ncbi:intersectin-1 isoform X2 [Onthophagus taurus]|uniref:intersectin-1 isoform X2 n=1 Tax=Onthophagus taurus TaxID=166361 RepID=UPI0039BE31EF
MSTAGTPSTDPWIILSKERARYEEHFKALKPNNGIVTGEQAKGFLLQSQLPPLVLGQIWALADTDADGKMDINEFSIACKLINLKLRGYEVPKALPPGLLASLKTQSPPAIPPLPNSHVNPPPRPEPPKVAPVIAQPPTVMPQSIPPLIPNLPTQVQPLNASTIPTGIVPPMQTAQPPIIPPMQPVQPLISGIPPITSQPLVGGIPPVNTVTPLMGQNGGIVQSGIPGAAPIIPPLPTNIPMSIHTGPPGSIVPPISSGAVVPAPHMSPVGSTTGSVGGVSVPSSTPRASITSLDKNTAPAVDISQEWSVNQHTKLKYTQIFNTTDRTRTGYLTGVQARNVMVQTKLPQSTLAQIWALSDMDADGRLGCEEFVLAMHLCEQASIGIPPPSVLPMDLIPPSFRRAPRSASRTASVSSQGSIQQDIDLASSLSQNTFEDKRKENFEKGQAELERRRKTLLDQQRKEAEERERKEREEIERREKARQEAERKRIEELEKQMREQQEKERQIEEERKRQAEQREAARREMERQRQLEWEKQRLQELQLQRQREQENVLKLKAKNQSLSIELNGLNDQVKELSQKICDTRVGVSNVKTTIDGMRSTRDFQMQEMSQIKNKLKEQNAKLLALSQEKIKLEAKNKMNVQMNDSQTEQTKQAFENKEINIKMLKEKVDDMQKEIDGKMGDIENNNSHLTDLKTQMAELLKQCENLYIVYEDKKNKVLEMKTTTKSVDYSTAWDSSAGGWGDTQNEWPVDNNWGTESAAPQTTAVSGHTTSMAGAVKYRALYAFEGRNSDEISFQPGDIIMVPLEQTGEPGWLAGEIRGQTGWFPESYVEPVDGVGVRGSVVQDAPPSSYVEELETKRLEGIVEVPETIPETQEPIQIPEPTPTTTTTPSVAEDEIEYYIANYPYQSVEQGDLTFNAGEMIMVVKKEGDWWTGKIGDRIGIFPSNYVQKVDVNTSTNPPEQPALEQNIVAAQDLQQDSAQTDNEVCQINENKEIEKPDFAAMSANTQTLRGNKKPEIASVIAPYQATSTEQLSLQRGQLIMIRKKTDSGWWEGELQAKGRKRQVGWFPASYVKVLNSSGRASGRTTPVSTTRMQQEVVLDKVVALYPYTAANPDELSFLKDDIISVTAREEQSWWRGELNGVSGLFPSNYVAPLQQSISPTDKKRQDCINELIQTEEAYIADMKVVHNVFEIPLTRSGIIDKNDIKAIFVNWQDILQCNKNFLEDLQQRRRSGSEIIGDVICAHLPKMTAYITFCSKQLDSAALLQKLTETSSPFRELVKQCQNEVDPKGMPLSSFLIKPMQRITRYPLLIIKILENTPDNHADSIYLRQALEAAEDFLRQINENVRVKENHERLDWLKNFIQSDLNIDFNSCTNKLGQRKFLHYGLLTKVKSGKELIGFLLNDFLLLAQPSKSICGQFTFPTNTNITFKLYKQPIMIQFLKASKGSAESVEHGTDSNRVLKIQNKKQIIALLTPSVNECSLWIKRIEEAKDEYERVVASIKPASYSRSQSCGRLLVLVQKGKRFIHLGKLFTENIYCKVSLGKQEQQTDIAKDNLSNGNGPQNGYPQIPNLVWNSSMQFHVASIKDDVLSLCVYEMCLFKPDVFLGRADLKLQEVYRESQNTNGPIIKKLILHQVESGEVTVKLDLQLFTNY